MRISDWSSDVCSSDLPAHRLDAATAVELDYATRDWTPAGKSITEALYEGYEVQSVVLPGAKPHPTRLVQSAAMASVAPPKPGYRPHVLDRLETGRASCRESVCKYV